MIPKILHQIWIGDKSKMPIGHIQTWIDIHPGYEHIIWDEEKIDSLNLINRDKYDIYYKQKCYNGAANVARVEIINKYGGIYLDADSYSTNNMDELLKLDFFAVYSPNIKGRVGNAFFGSVPNNKILIDYIKAIGELKKLHPSYKNSGGTTFGLILKKHDKLNSVLPAYSFYLTDRFNNKVPKEGNNYGTHYWGTTHNSY
jgi:mannosyltransferase OCH1-like enzyme